MNSYILIIYITSWVFVHHYRLKNVSSIKKMYIISKLSNNYYRYSLKIYNN